MQPLALRAAEGRPRRQRVTPKSTFAELTAKVQAAGLMRRRYGFYWSSMAACVVALAGVGTGMILLGDSWLQLLMAGALGLVMSQLGFLGHEAAHRQMFRSAHWNEWTARVLSTLLVGLSYGWWMNKHNRHHANPNKMTKDPDIYNNVVAFMPEAVETRTKFGVKFARVQGFFFLPLLLLEGLSLHATSIRYLIKEPDVRRKAVDIVFLTVRIGGYLAILFWLLPFGMAAAFLGVQLAVFGFLLGGAFAPNHVAMPIVPADGQFDFIRRQVLMSRNISGGPVVQVLHGRSGEPGRTPPVPGDGPAQPETGPADRPRALPRARHRLHRDHAVALLPGDAALPQRGGVEGPRRVRLPDGAVLPSLRYASPEPQSRPDDIRSKSRRPSITSWATTCNVCRVDRA